MLRASYYYLDVDPPGAQPAVPSEETKQRPVQSTQPTRSRLERWHPEAFVDPSTPTPEPAVKLEVDSTALQVTPTALPTLEELERLEEKKRPERRRAIGIAVGVIVGAAVVGLAIGGAVAMSNWEL
jgi:ferric-dicitrate binding protein FerR (iron transport regulator)